MEGDKQSQGALVTEAFNTLSGWLRFVQVGGAEGKMTLVSSVLETIAFSIPKGKSSEIRPS